MRPTWLKAKTIIPIATGGVVERGRLNELLGRRESARITIVRAPAGYGKTTMLSHWSHRFDEPVAWLSIDAVDNDPMRFWEYLIRTVSSAHSSGIDFRLLPLFNSQPQPPMELLVDNFLNELSSMKDDVTIVIDDYHLIENSTIHDMMTRFIDYLPANCKVYISSRTKLPLPLAKWRVKSWLTEIGMKQLCFTYEEAKEFYGQQNLSHVEYDSLQHVLDVTEGWAAGIQLAVLSLSTFGNKGSSLKQFSGNNPFVAEFLLKEILAIQPSSIQNFLISTAILDRLDPVICDALTDRFDSLEVLLELEQLGVFIVRLHTEEPIFRYHPLFVESLKRELKNRNTSDFVSSMYRKAAIIYHEQGNFVSAIELALEGQLYEFADKWIQTITTDLFKSGQVITFNRWVETMLENNYPVHLSTMVMYAFSLAMSHRLLESNQIILNLEELQVVNQWMEKAEYTGVAGDFFGVKAYVLIVGEGDIEQATELFQKRLENRPEETKWDAISILHNRVEPSLLRTIIGARGKLWSDEKMMAFYDLFRHTTFKELNITGYSFGIRAEALYERNRIEEALPELEEAIRFGHLFQDPGLFVPMYLLKSRIYVANERFIAAHALLDYAMEKVKEHHWLNVLHAEKIRFYLQEDSVAQAENEYSKIALTNGQKRESSQPFYTLTHVRLLLAQKQAEEALKLIVQVRVRAIQEEQISTIVETTVLEAICQSVLLNEDAALAALHEAMVQGERYGYIRTFIDEEEVMPLLRKYLKRRQSGISTPWDSVPLSFVKQLLQGDKNNPKKGGAMDALTPREKEVLQLLASGASNRDIASKLFLTEGTVRVYLSNIYGKLGVKSRTQALLLTKE
ncbi:LuxR C-terminal-related transcriptional regulator [Sporosarcina sp. FSL K6-2383]|uniref:LuxR C-terminal-related transcriptional regulator n=1 Tax=Sporosarcina sp. FSL K6-2383 TaxID=2921556 RepID=UPI0031599704